MTPYTKDPQPLKSDHYSKDISAKCEGAQPGRRSHHRPAHLISKTIENQTAPTQVGPVKKHCVAGSTKCGGGKPNRASRSAPSFFGLAPIGRIRPSGRDNCAASYLFSSGTHFPICVAGYGPTKGKPKANFEIVALRHSFALLIRSLSRRTPLS